MKAPPAFKMSLSLLRYICNVNHFDGKTLFRAGEIYIFPVDPGSNFTLTDSDPVLYDTRYVHRDSDGTYYFAGNGANYDDWKFPLSQSKQGSNLKPDYDFTNNGYLFPQNNTAEVLYMSDLTSHRMQIKENMVWYPHMHYIQDEELIPVFEYRIKLTAPGKDEVAFTSWIPTTGDLVFPWTGNTMHQIILFPAFDAYALGCTSIATIGDVQLRRNDNVVAGDVLGKQFDIHVLFDAPLGSGQEFIK